MMAWIGSATMLVAILGGPPHELAGVGQVVLAERMSPSLVQVEYTLRFDKGEAPQGAGFVTRCPNCGQYHGSYDLASLVTEERPLRSGGFLVGPDRVVAPDVVVHPRFIERIAVRYGDEVVECTPESYALTQNAVVLRLAGPLSGARVLSFDTEAEPPYLAATYEYADGAWTTTIQPAFKSVCLAEGGRRFVAVPPACVIIDQHATPVGMSMNAEVPAADEWKGSPLQWPAVPADELTALCSRMESAVDQSLLRVSLSFRSPKQDTHESAFMWSEPEDDEEATERNVLGLVVDPRTVLVLVHLKPDVTARLERIRVHPPSGEAVSATFRHSLKDHGCFIAEADSPLPSPVSLSPVAIDAFRDRLLPSVSILLHGEDRVCYFGHHRIASFETRWRQQLYPELPVDDDGIFLFDWDGRVVALPVVRRRKATEEESWGGDQPVLTPALYLKNALADLAANVDLNNVPVSEEEENRLAWMGVELQSLGRELARVNGVSHLTQDGETGALVSYVYLGSPAASVGVEPGYILLRLHVAGEPVPLQVSLDESGPDFSAMMWDAMDEVPQEFLEQMPVPWPPVRNRFTEALTSIGFGRKYRAEFFHDGRILMKDLEVAQGPPNFETARRFKSEPLGLTVRDLTYEVRRRFQKSNDDPGVIVSKVEQGEKAAIAGIKPYEIITHVNDAPVTSADTFRTLIEDAPELRLLVSRMTQSRLVRIRMPAPDEADIGSVGMPTPTESTPPHPEAE